MESIKIPRNFTSHVFYMFLLPVLYPYFDSMNMEDIEIDLSDVVYIDPVVIPNMINIGLIMKQDYNRIAKLRFSYNTKLLQYLDLCGFKSFISNNKVFEFNEDYFGGYSLTDPKSKYISKVMYADNETNMGDVAFGIKESYYLYCKILGLNPDTNPMLLTSKSAYGRKISSVFYELVKNVSMHSKSHCLYTIQYYAKNNKGSYAISDTGTGYYNSIYDKILKGLYHAKIVDDYFYMNPRSMYKSLLGIVEAIHFRDDRTKYGLYHIVYFVTKNQGTIRFHSSDVSLIITPRNARIYLDVEALKKSIISDRFIQKEIECNHLIFHNAMYKGVHIEIEVSGIQK